MERFWLFWPEILPIAIIGVVIFIFLKIFTTILKKELNSIYWLNRHKFMVDFFVSQPLALILAPTLEELLFRLPLLLMFTSLTSDAWTGIWISSCAFGFIHIFGAKVTGMEVMLAYMMGQTQSDDFKEETQRIALKTQGNIVIKRLIAFVFTTGAGVLISYFGIKYQSLWLCVGIHAAWNLIVPGVMMIVTMLVVMILIQLGLMPRPPIPPPGQNPFNRFRY